MRAITRGHYNANAGVATARSRPPSVITVRGRRTAFASAARRASRLRKSASKPALAVSGDPTARGTISRVAGDDVKESKEDGGAATSSRRVGSRPDPGGSGPNDPPFFRCASMAYAALSRAEGTSSGFAEEGTSSNDANPPSRARSCHTSSSAFPSGGAASFGRRSTPTPWTRRDSAETPRETPRTSLPSLRFRAEDFVGDAKKSSEVLASSRDASRARFDFILRLEPPAPRAKAVEVAGRAPRRRRRSRPRAVRAFVASTRAIGRFRAIGMISPDRIRERVRRRRRRDSVSPRGVARARRPGATAGFRSLAARAPPSRKTATRRARRPRFETTSARVHQTRNSPNSNPETVRPRASPVSPRRSRASPPPRRAAARPRAGSACTRGRRRRHGGGGGSFARASRPGNAAFFPFRVDIAKPSFPKLSPKRPRASSAEARGDAPLGDAGAEADRDAGAGAQTRSSRFRAPFFASASRRSSWRASTTRGVGGLRLGESSLSDSSDAVKDVGCVGDARAARFSLFRASGTLGRRASSGTAARVLRLDGGVRDGRQPRPERRVRAFLYPAERHRRRFQAFQRVQRPEHPARGRDGRLVPPAHVPDQTAHAARRARGGDKGDDASATRGAGRRAFNVSAVSRASSLRSLQSVFGGPFRFPFRSRVVAWERAAQRVEVRRVRLSAIAVPRVGVS